MQLKWAGRPGSEGDSTKKGVNLPVEQKKVSFAALCHPRFLHAYSPMHRKDVCKEMGSAQGPKAHFSFGPIHAFVESLPHGAGRSCSGLVHTPLGFFMLELAPVQQTLDCAVPCQAQLKRGRIFFSICHILYRNLYTVFRIYAIFKHVNYCNFTKCWKEILDL